MPGGGGRKGEVTLPQTSNVPSRLKCPKPLLYTHLSALCTTDTGVSGGGGTDGGGAGRKSPCREDGCCTCGMTRMFSLNGNKK